MRSTLQKAREAPESTKARILVNAEEIFATKGFAGASTREIAAKARVNISGLHYHWESKETLYSAVFRNIYDRILEVVRRSIPGEARDGEPIRGGAEQAMGSLFDFFADHPNIPKLLVRRLLENDDGRVDIEGDILVPAWKVLSAWMQEYGTRKLDEAESQLFMLTALSVVLVFLLDSRQFTRLLGGSVATPAIRERLRAHITGLVLTLLHSR